VVEHIDREASEPDDLGEPVNDARDIVECVGERAAVRHVGLPEPRKIRCDNAKPVRELWNEIAEHMTGAGKTVKQQERWRVFRPCLAAEDVEPVDIDFPEIDLMHLRPHSSCRPRLHEPKRHWVFPWTRPWSNPEIGRALNRGQSGGAITSAASRIDPRTIANP